MTRATPIASLVESMLASGAAADVIVCAVEAAELHGQVRGKALVTTGSQRKGTRLPENWQPSEPCIAYAIDRGMTRDRVAIEAEKFKNYWTAKSGAGATKRDWSATWSNWIITAMERGYGPASNQGQRPGTYSTPRRASTGADAVLAGMGRIAKRIVEKRNAAGPSDRQVARGTDIAQEFDLEPNRT